MNSLPPQWCRYLYCCLTHSSCVEVTQIWGLVHVEKVLSVYVVHIDILTMLDCFTELTILVLFMCLYILYHTLWPEVSVTF